MSMTVSRLDELLQTCRDRFDEMPTVCFVVTRLCSDWLDEYADQGIPMSRALEIDQMEAQIERILSAPVNIREIDELIRAVRRAPGE